VRQAKGDALRRGDQSLLATCELGGEPARRGGSGAYVFYSCNFGYSCTETVIEWPKVGAAVAFPGHAPRVARRGVTEQDANRASSARFARELSTWRQSICARWSLPEKST
jgi:hypothetical protein